MPDYLKQVLGNKYKCKHRKLRNKGLNKHCLELTKLDAESQKYHVKLPIVSKLATKFCFPGMPTEQMMTKERKMLEQNISLQSFAN
jgi:hypothetical protein